MVRDTRICSRWEREMYRLCREAGKTQPPPTGYQKRNRQPPPTANRKRDRKSATLDRQPEEEQHQKGALDGQPEEGISHEILLIRRDPIN